MALYTFLIEYAGGTYVGQGEGATLEAASEDWSAKFHLEMVFGRSTAAFVKAVRRAVDTGGTVPLNGITNVWCFSGIFSKQLILGNVVLTQQTRRRSGADTTLKI